jgi:hypothetical protein
MKCFNKSIRFIHALSPILVGVILFLAAFPLSPTAFGWEPPLEPPPIGDGHTSAQSFDLVCDDGDSCFSYNGGWDPPSNPNQYCKYAGDMRFGYACWLAPDCQPNTDNYSVFWRPHRVSGFVPGNYEVFAYIPRCDSFTPHTQSAKYYLRHAGDSASTAHLMATVNQAHPYQDNNNCSAGARWVSLGTYYFDSDDYVELRAWTDESGTQWGTRHHLIFADAIKFSFRGYNDSLKPDGRITSPAGGSTIGPGTINIAARAWDNAGGSGVKQVKFRVYYNGKWYDVGSDSSAPYARVWSVPSSLRSQRVKFAIHVADNANNVTQNAGGIRIVNFIESHQNPGVKENWVPANKRAYLNQLALSPNGNMKCSVAGMSMVLAMNGLISSDFNTMSAKANEMYPRILGQFPGGGWAPYVYLMANELERQGAIAWYPSSGMSADDAWALVKNEVNAGRPVIIRTEPKVVTDAGHILVAVGYREKLGSRKIITYDPFGRWLGTCCTNNYDRNSTSPSSHKGKWVFYDFDKVFGGWNYLITARASNAQSVQINTVDEPDTSPDETSDEPEDITTYDGVEIKTRGQIFLPLIMSNR